MMDIEEKLRTGHVRRWNIVAVTREQTIAEHMHRVGQITEEILRILGMFDWNSNVTLNAMRWAAIHDRHEVALGDLPSTSKKAIRAEYGCDNDGDRVCSIESAAARIDPEAEELRQCVEKGGPCEIAGDIVKYADLLEALNYLGIFGAGSHAKAVWTGLQVEAVKAAAAVARHLDPQHSQETRGELVGLITKLLEGKQWS